MAQGNVITTSDGGLVFAGGPDCPELAGAVAFDRATKCCTFEGRNGIYRRADFSGYPLGSYHEISFDRMCMRLLIYCPQTMNNADGGCTGLVTSLATPTHVFRYAQCHIGPTQYRCPPGSPPECKSWDHLWRYECDNSLSNCLKLGATLGACGNPDLDPTTKTLPARPPYYWPSCCEPVDFRPADCTCMEEIGAGDLLWLPQPEDIKDSLAGLPCKPRCDGEDQYGDEYPGSSCGPEQFVLYIWLEYVTAHVRTRAHPSSYQELGLYAVNLLGGGIIRGWACGKPFDCDTGNSAGCA